MAFSKTASRGSRPTRLPDSLSALFSRLTLDRKRAFLRLWINQSWFRLTLHPLSVGATQLRNTSILGGEVAAFQPDPDTSLLDYSSGGGFSDVFARPKWQVDAVGSYLRHHDPGYAPTVFNRSGRAFPDVAAMGLNLTTVYLDRVFGIGGTSAATPIFASLINLLNEERLRAGKTPVGFLNPVMYAHPDMFNDVIEGSNPGCGTGGFSAAAGWDPVTGLGTPNYTRIRDVFMNLP